MVAPQNGYKRSAPSSSYSAKPPQSKYRKTGSDARSFKSKPQVEARRAGPSAGKPKPPYVKESEDKRRKRPLTQGGGYDDISMSDNDQNEGEMDMKHDGDDEGQEAGAGEESIDKKPRMTKVERAALHAAQPHRTALLPSHPLLHDTLLPLWEKARQTGLEKEERRRAVTALWDAVKGRVGEISKGHKGGRVLQTIVKYGGKEERVGVAMELQPRWREMMESKYSKFLMAKLIRYCPSMRPLLISAVQANLLPLLQHSEAVGPLSDFFDLWATNKEKRALVRGFYPREVKIFDGGKDGKHAEGLEVVLESLGDGAGRGRVLNELERTITEVFNATQKSALTQGIFHRLVLEYLTCVYRFLPAEDADTKMHELLTTSLESLPDIMHTKDGSAVVRELIVRGAAKERKQILQQLKKHLEVMCKDLDAQTVLFTAFDCVDDTKLMGKAFVGDIASLAPSLASDKHGRRVLMYLLIPTSTRHFLPTTLGTLSTSAQKAKDIGTSKKDPQNRRKEITDYASPGLLQAIEENAEVFVRDPGAGLFVQDALLYSQGDKTGAMRALANLVQTPYPEAGPDEIDVDVSSGHILDLPHSSRTFKTLLTGGHFNNSRQKVDVADALMPAQFASILWDALVSEEAGGEENVVRVAKGSATFVLVQMIEALEGSEAMLSNLRRVLGRSVVIQAIRDRGRKGSALLAERLEAL